MRFLAKPRRSIRRRNSNDGGDYRIDTLERRVLLSADVTPTGSIAGTVYHDLTADHVRQSGDAPLAGRTVWLDADNDYVLDQTERATYTSAFGTYQFNDLPDGNYIVRQSVMGGWFSTSTTPLVSSRNWTALTFCSADGSRSTPT